MRLKLIEQPIIEPLDLAAVKLHCRIEVDTDDSLLNGLITAARSFVEKYTQRALIDQKWQASFDSSDCPFKGRTIELGKVPVSSVVSITSYNSEDVPTVFSASNYRLSGDRAALKEGSSWPSLGRSIDALEVQFIAGYGPAGSDVPSPVRQAMFLLISHWYENREASWDPVMKKDEVSIQIPFGVTAILDGYKVFSI